MKHLMRQTVLVFPRPSTDAYGRDSFLASTAVRGRFVLKSIIIIDSKGEEVQADAVCYLPNTVSGLDIGDKVEYNSISYRVIKLEQPMDDLSVKFIKVTLKKKL